jgi:hypothetical protein
MQGEKLESEPRKIEKEGSIWNSFSEGVIN